MLTNKLSKIRFKEKDYTLYSPLEENSNQINENLYSDTINLEGLGKKVAAMNNALGKRMINNSFYSGITTRGLGYEPDLDNEDILIQPTFKYISSEWNPSGLPKYISNLWKKGKYSILLDTKGEKSSNYKVQIINPINSSSNSNLYNKNTLEFSDIFDERIDWQVWKRTTDSSGSWHEWHCINAIDADEIDKLELIIN